MDRYTILENNLLFYMDVMLWIMYIDDVCTGCEVDPSIKLKCIWLCSCTIRHWQSEILISVQR